MYTFSDGLFISATGTEVGKTIITAALLACLAEHGRAVVALKPAESGCSPLALDAEWLATLSGRPDLAYARGFSRLHAPLSPAAAAARAGTAPPSSRSLADACRAFFAAKQTVLIEGAGGILVPLNDTETMADLATALGFPVVLVARDELGTLSHTLTAYEASVHRGLRVAGVVLNRARAEVAADPSSNLRMLRQRLPVPVLAFPELTTFNPPTLTAAARTAELVSLVAGRRDPGQPGP